jgi:hypothetical protein
MIEERTFRIDETHSIKLSELQKLKEAKNGVKT